MWPLAYILFWNYTKKGDANLYGIFGTTWKQKQAKSLEVLDA